MIARTALIVLLALAGPPAAAGVAFAQATPNSTTPQPVAPSTAQPTPAPAPTSAVEPQGYTYAPEGRRDPFVSLVRRGVDVQGSAPATRPPGLPGLMTSEVSLRGTLKGREGFVAMLEGVDKKTYLARVGDRLFDGTIRTITADAVVILQRVNDPLAPETQREVRKMLRQTEEAK